jgi:hypothetical protein
MAAQLLLPKDRAALAYIYELDEFKSFKKLCLTKRAKIADQIIGCDMSQPGSSERISMLQGQAIALEFILLEIKNYHKQEMQKAK